MKIRLTVLRWMWRLLPGLVALMVLPSAMLWAPAAAQEDQRADARPWLEPEPAVVSLRGFVVEKRYYGPPGHGENPAEDRKVDGWLLLLVTPINIRADAEEETSSGSHDIRQVQLVVIGRERRHLFKKLRNLLGQEVYATGKLYEARTGWYWVLTGLELMDISPVPRDTRGADLKW